MKNNFLKLTYLFSSLGYSVFEVVQGLFFHPHQTAQFLVNKKLFKFFVFTPLFVLAIFKLSFIILGNFELVPHLKIVKLFLWYWVKYFCLIWQGVIFYLFFRFWYAWRSKNKQ